MPKMTKPVFRAALVAGMVLLAACSSTKKEEYVERPVDELYNEAMDQLQKKSYDAAAKAFDEVDRQHPYSIWATKAQLMSAFTQYQNGRYDEAIIGLDRFLQLHPSHRDAPYAYYLKALCYYEQISDVGRDQKMTENAMKTLQEVVDRYPTSRYARDARLKIDLTRDHLAGKEMAVGRWYQTQGHHLAALNRFKTVAQTFQTTTHVPEALHRMVEIYEGLGLAEEAKKTAAVLGHNYPGNEWYMDTYSLVNTGQPYQAGTDPKTGEKTSSGWFDWLW